MSDYDSLSDEQLNIEVAKRLGFKVEYMLVNGERRYFLLDPNRIRVTHRYEDEADLWRGALEHEEIAHYATDANAALELWHGGDDFNLSHEDGVWIGEPLGKSADPFAEVFGKSESPARATAITWLMWQDKQVKP